MSDGEVLVLFLSLAVTALGWLRWNWSLVLVRPLLCSWSQRSVLFFLPFACGALLFAVLCGLAADDVRNDGRYLVMYQAMGSAWVLGAASLLPTLGYSARDDVLERRNPAALFAICGALVGLTLCFAGGNIGNGPGWWVVVFSAAISTGTFLCVWACFEWLARPSDAITHDRDRAAGLRLAGFLVAIGVICGRAVAGDWISVEVTLRDFALRVWPAVLLVAAGVCVERLAPPQTGRGVAAVAALGLLPALIYLGGAATWLSISGIGN